MSLVLTMFQWGWFVSQAVDEHIVQAIVDVAIFLEFSGDEAVNPDAAVAMFEQMASTLRMSSAGSRSSLCSSFEELAPRYSGEQSDFVRGLAESLALVSD